MSNNDFTLKLGADVNEAINEIKKLKENVINQLGEITKVSNSQIQNTVGNINDNLSKINENFKNSFTALSNSAGAFFLIYTEIFDRVWQSMKNIEKEQESAEVISYLQQQAGFQIDQNIVKKYVDITPYTETTLNNIVKYLYSLKNVNQENANTIADNYIKTVANLAKFTGQGAEEIAQGVAKIIEAPDKASRILRQYNIILNDTQTKTIETLVKTGKIADAQAYIFDNINSRFGDLYQNVDLTENIEKNFEILKKTFYTSLTAIVPFLEAINKILETIRNLDPTIIKLVSRMVVMYGISKLISNTFNNLIGVFRNVKTTLLTLRTTAFNFEMFMRGFGTRVLANLIPIVGQIIAIGYTIYEMVNQTKEQKQEIQKQKTEMEVTRDEYARLMLELTKTTNEKEKIKLLKEINDKYKDINGTVLTLKSTEEEINKVRERGLEILTQKIRIEAYENQIKEIAEEIIKLEDEKEKYKNNRDKILEMYKAQHENIYKQNNLNKYDKQPYESPYEKELRNYKMDLDNYDKKIAKLKEKATYILNKKSEVQNMLDNIYKVKTTNTNADTSHKDKETFNIREVIDNIKNTYKTYDELYNAFDKLLNQANTGIIKYKGKSYNIEKNKNEIISYINNEITRINTIKEKATELQGKISAIEYTSEVVKQFKNIVDEYNNILKEAAEYKIILPSVYNDIVQTAETKMQTKIKQYFDNLNKKEPNNELEKIKLDYTEKINKINTTIEEINMLINSINIQNKEETKTEFENYKITLQNTIDKLTKEYENKKLIYLYELAGLKDETKEYEEKLKVIKEANVDQQIKDELTKKVERDYFEYKIKKIKESDNLFVNSFVSGINKIAQAGQEKLTSMFSKIFRNGKTLLDQFAIAFTETFTRLAMEQASMQLLNFIFPAGGGFLGSIGKIFGFATGGLVIGAGSPENDQIPAKLSRGEYVVNSKQTQKYINLLDAINNDKAIAIPNNFNVNVNFSPLQVSAKGRDIKKIYNLEKRIESF